MYAQDWMCTHSSCRYRAGWIRGVACRFVLDSCSPNQPILKALILCAGAGIVLTLVRLVIEKRKEDKHVPSNDE